MFKTSKSNFMHLAKISKKSVMIGKGLSYECLLRKMIASLTSLSVCLCQLSQRKLPNFFTMTNYSQMMNSMDPHP